LSADRNARVLIVDDEVEMATAIADHLSYAGWHTQVVESGREALLQARATMPDVVITDLRMAEVDGLDVLDGVRELDPTIPVIVMTAFGAIESAITAIKRGAWHYLTKPLVLAELSVYVERAVAERRLRDEHRALKRIAQDRSAFAQMVGRSQAMRQLYTLIEQVATASAPVMIRGESGTGKELVARALHFSGGRRDRPFVAVNCTALPEHLLESELFGHVRGAFTGAANARRGLFVEADGGTLFLDEIGDMAPALQAKLLRALEDGEVRAVGADVARRVDVRVIAATHQDLEEQVQSGRFRADLFYRLDVVALRLPPLRERPEDVPLLLEHFLDQALRRNPASVARRFAPDAIAALSAAPWYGNVRELENVVERLVIVARHEELQLADVHEFAPLVLARSPSSSVASAFDRLLPMRELEDEYIAWVLKRCDGSKPRAAEILGLDVTTLYRRGRQKR
jgi:two-component system response regulator HydG